PLSSPSDPAESKINVGGLGINQCCAKLQGITPFLRSSVASIRSSDLSSTSALIRLQSTGRDSTNFVSHCVVPLDNQRKKFCRISAAFRHALNSDSDFLGF